MTVTCLGVRRRIRSTGTIIIAISPTPTSVVQPHALWHGIASQLTVLNYYYQAPQRSLEKQVAKQVMMDGGTERPDDKLFESGWEPHRYAL